MDDCIFCKIIAREIPASSVYEDDKTFVFLDIHPNNLGHALVVPKKHFRNIFDLDEDTMLATGKTLKKIAKALMDSGLAEGINIISNNERPAGQLVFHAHTHIIPRIATDGLKHWPAKEYKQGQAEEIVEKIKKAL